ncbi:MULTISPECIES: TetR/AcrR family transcriptional regulator [Hydrogenophaga]|uniref:TetR family transcriptional regulator n=1 Tax=Hydrogenophaga electricum TaxID=1230953 RepID=A0ABQ6C4A9_9BURK|nr:MULTISPECIES: TetR/AcrR family transcriptional regulator [Hydrogenophaga]GLS14584.1 TetR family transcriptional regulator [Hydrogenophaga electricum]
MPAATVSRHTQTDTRQLILRLARELLLTRSYLGLNFQALADQVGIRKASLYHHFPSKEALGVSLVDEARQRFERWQAGVTSEPAARQVLAYIRLFRDQIGAGTRVCPVGATAGEWSCLEPSLQSAVQALWRTQTDWLTGVFQRLDLPAPSGSSGPDAARQWATHVSAVCQGALMHARVQSDPKVFDAAVAPLIDRLPRA